MWTIAASTHSKKEPHDATDQPRVIQSAALFDGQRLVLIDHAAQQYRLLVTRNDWLILQK